MPFPESSQAEQLARARTHAGPAGLRGKIGQSPQLGSCSPAIARTRTGPTTLPGVDQAEARCARMNAPACGVDDRAADICRRDGQRDQPSGSANSIGTSRSSVGTSRAAAELELDARDEPVRDDERCHRDERRRPLGWDEQRQEYRPVARNPPPSTSTATRSRREKTAESVCPQLCDCVLLDEVESSPWSRAARRRAR